jgi:hypothetical protein
MVALVNIKNVHGALPCYIGSRIRCIPDPKGVKNYYSLNAKLINQPSSELEHIALGNEGKWTFAYINGAEPKDISVYDAYVPE